MSIAVRVTTALLALGSAACGDAEPGSNVIEFRINDVGFAVPAEVVRSVRYGQAGFIRINDPETPIEFVYDAQLEQKLDKRGYRMLFSVNDGETAHLEYRRSPAGALVVCRVAAAAPYGGCGSPLEFEGSTWTVLFPQARASDADAFRRRAAHALQQYRTLRPHAEQN